MIVPCFGLVPPELKQISALGLPHDHHHGGVALMAICAIAHPQDLHPGPAQNRLGNGGIVLHTTRPYVEPGHQYIASPSVHRVPGTKLSISEHVFNGKLGADAHHACLDHRVNQALAVQKRLRVARFSWCKFCFLRRRSAIFFALVLWPVFGCPNLRVYLVLFLLLQYSLVLVCWSVGLLVCWSVGLLVCWSVGLLVCWYCL